MQRSFVTILITIFWFGFASSQELSNQQLFGTQWSEEVSNEDLSEEKERGLIFPNPTYGTLNFDLSSLSLEKNGSPYYKVIVRNVIAKEIFSAVFTSKTFKKDFGFLEKGTYLLSVEDYEAKKLFARRLVIITP